jgi:hypothetical protein
MDVGTLGATLLLLLGLAAGGGAMHAAARMLEFSTTRWLRELNRAAPLVMVGVLAVIMLVLTRGAWRSLRGETGSRLGGLLKAFLVGVALLYAFRLLSD